MVQNLVEGAGILTAIVTLPLGVLTAMFVGTVPAAVVFVIGWFLLTPLLVVGGNEIWPLLRARLATEEETATDAEDPLEELKGRYARGEIDDAEFERRVERLVELDVVDARHVDAAAEPARTAESPDQTDETEREPSVERT